MTKEELLGIFTHIPVLETERLCLRKLSETDAVDMYEYSKDPAVVEHLLWDVHPSCEYTAQYLAYLDGEYAMGRFFDWALVERASGKMIGTCGFTNIDTVNNSAEIGYVLNPAFRGRGIAPEAARAVIDFGFRTLGLMRISAICMAENQASLRVMQKCGMQREGLLRAAVYVKERYRDVIVASITAKEYLSN